MRQSLVLVVALVAASACDQPLELAGSASAGAGADGGVESSMDKRTFAPVGAGGISLGFNETSGCVDRCEEGRVICNNWNRGQDIIKPCDLEYEMCLDDCTLHPWVFRTSTTLSDEDPSLMLAP